MKRKNTTAFYRKIRIYTEVRSMKEGDIISFNDEERNHLFNVLRCIKNDEIYVFNDIIGEYRVRIINKLSYEVIKSVSVYKKPKYKVSIAFSYIKKQAIEDIIRYCCQIGDVHSVYPLIMDRTIIGGNISEKRLKKIARCSLEQSGGFCMPHMHCIDKMDDFLFTLSQNSCIIACDDFSYYTGKYTHIKDFFYQNTKKFSEYVVLVGPEGGFSPRERDLIKTIDSCFVVNLGSRIMRVETSVIFSFSFVYHILNEC